MKHTRLLLVFLAALALSLVTPAQGDVSVAQAPISASAVSSSGGTIQGRIFQADGVTPAYGFRVMRWSPESTGYQGYDSTSTDEEGRFYLFNVDAGRYLLRVYEGLAGCLLYSRGGLYADGTLTDAEADATEIEVAEGATVEITATMAPAGAVSLDVYQADGATRSEHYDVRLDDGLGYGVSACQSQDEQGETVAGSVKPGQYQIKITASGSEEPHTLGGWYKNGGITQDQTEATWVPITATHTTLLQVVLAEGGAVSGIIWAPDGTTRAANYQVAAYGAGNAEVLYGDGGATGYVVPHLPPGQVWLRISMSYGADPHSSGGWWSQAGLVSSRDQADPVLVTAGQTTSAVDAALKSAGSIAGYVYRPDGTTRVVSAYVVAEPCPPSEWGGGTGWTASGDGLYRVSGLVSGPYCIRVQPSTEHYGERVNLDVRGGWYAPGQLVADQADAEPFNVIGGGERRLDLTLLPAGYLTGRLFLPDGVTPAELIAPQIWTVDDDGSWNHLGSYWLDEHGVYAIGQLAQGDYYLKMEVNHWNGANLTSTGGWYADGQLVPDRAQAQPIQIREGMGTELPDISLLPAGALRGRLLEADGITPVGEGMVQLYPTEGESASRSVAQDVVEAQAGGWFAMGGLGSGDYVLDADPRSGNGYSPHALGGWYHDGGTASDRDQATLISVELGATTTITMVLDLGGAIALVILGSDESTPVQRGAASALLPLDDLGRLRTASSKGLYGQGSAFLLSNLVPGQYYVSGQPSSTANAGDPLIRGGYYASGSPVDSVGEAELVSVVAGETLQLTMQSRPAAAFTGVVLGYDGQPATSGQVSAYNCDTQSGSGYASADDQGRYVLGHLPGGTHKIRAYSVQYRNDYVGSWYSAEGGGPVLELGECLPALEGQIMSGIDFALAQGGHITGTFYLADGTTPLTNPVRSLYVEAVGSEPNLGTYDTVVQWHAGTYTLSPLPVGDYVVRGNSKLTLPYTSPYYNGARNPANAQLVTVVAGQTTGEIDFVMTEPDAFAYLPAVLK